MSYLGKGVKGEMKGCGWCSELSWGSCHKYYNRTQQLCVQFLRPQPKDAASLALWPQDLLFPNKCLLRGNLLHAPHLHWAPKRLLDNTETELIFFLFAKQKRSHRKYFTQGDVENEKTHIKKKKSYPKQCYFTDILHSSTQAYHFL